MMAFVRLLVFVVLIELVFYALLSIYIRSLRREELEKEWDSRHPDRQGDSSARREFVRRSMIGFRKTLRARLVGLVLILPLVLIATIVILVNYN
ncbi:hypothetical protein [Paracoccus aminophilus]|uniref:Uncharacterized protein n=1 Tax=Paracoccus aminophilus JCM 7686 TaxID=1367847 RepID=S5XSR5_PARAH|nr:hypothetical protein [Paracoccus aminophilus]AGT08167.1 hypothetical protein JCM7686_1058 [Paracoccus aminophilus JCM 7686]